MANKLESLADLSGELIADQFEVIRQTAHRRYAVRCNKCHALMEGYRHEDLLSKAVCHNRGCNRPKPITLRDFQEEQERQDAAEREERERPLREAEAAYQNSLKEIGKATRERIATGKEDAETWRSIVDTTGTSMSIAQAEKHNAEMVNAYRAAHPEWNPSPANVKALTGYWSRNGIQILSVPIIERSVARLREYGLIEERPEPEPMEEIAEPTSEPVQGDDGSEWGIDDKTGEPLKLSRYQVSRLTADQYLKFARIPASQLTRPVQPVR